MKFEIQKILPLSGNRASIYTIYNTTTSETLLDQFIRENETDFEEEVDDLIARLNTIGHKTGLRVQYIKVDEGKLGDGVVALFDEPDKSLRLYCIKMSNITLIVGGGGNKPKGMKAFQESEKLTAENYFLRAVSKLIDRRLKDKDIRYNQDGMDLMGDLSFEDTDLKY